MVRKQEGNLCKKDVDTRDTQDRKGRVRSVTFKRGSGQGGPTSISNVFLMHMPGLFNFGSTNII